MTASTEGGDGRETAVACLAPNRAPNRSLEADVAIVGGGPAGATLAALLASAGRPVVLLRREAVRESMPEEALVQGARNVLARAGVLDLLQPLLADGPERQGVIWGEEGVRWRTTGDGGRGFQVVRAALDPALRAGAAGNGARVLAIRSTCGPIGVSEAGAVRFLASDGAESEVRARVVAVATGRWTSPAILPVEVADALPETVALVATGPAPPEWSGSSVIEAVPEGWWWWLPLHAGGASLTLLTDAGEVNAQGRIALWNAARAHATGPARSFDPPPASGAVATARRLVTPSEALLVGDAACTVDPLSSQGLEKAFFSAHESFLAISTILDDPAAAPAIRTWLQARHRGVFEAHARRGLELYSEERRFEGSRFWRERHGAGTRRGISAREIPMDGRRLVVHPNLHRAACFHPAGGRLIAGIGFSIDPGSEALDAIGEVPLGSLIEAIAGGGTPKEIVDRASRLPALFRLSPGTVLEVLSRLVACSFVQVEHQR